MVEDGAGDALAGGGGTGGATGVAAEGIGGDLGRLWAPYRLAYVTSAVVPADESCPFCAIPDHPSDHSLVVARGERVYAVLNLHPYNPGHLMVVPYRHVADLEELDDAETAELATMTRDAVRAVRQAASPHAFNVGLNLGSAAGGSLAAHLHQHVVPRWGGDANFATVISGTKVMPQLLEETRDVLRATWPDVPEHAPRPRGRRRSAGPA